MTLFELAYAHPWWTLAFTGWVMFWGCVGTTIVVLAATKRLA